MTKYFIYLTCFNNCLSFWTEKKYIYLSAILSWIHRKIFHKYFWGCVFNFRWQSYIVVLHVVQPFSVAKQMLEGLLRMRLRQCYPIFLQGMMGRQHTNLAGNWFCIQSCTLRESSVRQITFWTDLPLVCFCNDMCICIMIVSENILYCWVILVL